MPIETCLGTVMSINKYLINVYLSELAIDLSTSIQSLYGWASYLHWSVSNFKWKFCVKFIVLQMVWEMVIIINSSMKYVEMCI